MNRSLLLLPVALVLGCAEPTVEKKRMALELRTSTTREKDETQVQALLTNTGAEPVTVLLEPQLHRTAGSLTDEQGKELVARDARATQGVRAFEHGKIKTQVLRPGESVEVESFSLLPSVGQAMAGPMSWDLTEVRSKRLTLVMSYEVTDEGAGTAKAHGAPDVAVGRWTSSPQTLPYRK